jgi:hypothetical protein
MSIRSNDDLDQLQTQTLKRFDDDKIGLRELALRFKDPADFYVVCPVKVPMSQLVRLYHQTFEDEERHKAPSIMRKRARIERWVEQRAVFQAKRSSARRDAILNAEADVMAIMGIEFHSRRLRRLMERWEVIDEYVMTELEACESQEAQFGTALRDACRELREIENELKDFLPMMSIPDKAKQFWTAQAGTRDEMIGRIDERLQTIGGGDTAASVFDLIEGGMSVVEG